MGQIVSRLLLLILGLLVPLALAELGLQVRKRLAIADLAKIYRPCGECSYLYEHIPGSIGINSFGLRGPEIGEKKKRRVLLIGDSVTYGAGVRGEETFASELQRRVESIQVINGGVSGYSTYNEARFLRDRLLSLNPDLVVLQFCLNDISDPRFHLNAVARIDIKIPDDAVPNPDILKTIPNAPALKLQKLLWLKQSALFRLFRELVFHRQAGWILDHVGIRENGKFWPTYISGELPLDMAPLLDYDSREWVWLRRQLDMVKELTAGKLALLFIPLAYQLEVGYPLHPEELISRYCRESGVRCLNALPALQQQGADYNYIMNRSDGFRGPPDVWHLTREGSNVVAGILEEEIKMGL